MNPGVSAKAARWSARVLSGLILLFWGFFLAAHLLRDEGRPSRPLNAVDYAIVASVVAALAGLAMSWRWEPAGAVTTLLAIAVCAALNWKVLVFPGTLIPVAALLFLTAWWIGRRRSQLIHQTQSRAGQAPA
jgi:chromate transport protein ChrA